MGSKKAGKKGKRAKGKRVRAMAISFVADHGHSIIVGKGETSGTIRDNQQLRLRRRAIGERIREVLEERDRLSRIWHVTEGCSRHRLGLQIEVLADELGALIALRDAVRDPDDPTWEPPAELDEVPAGLVRLGCQVADPTDQADQPDPTDRFNNDLAAREQADFEARLRLACSDGDIRQLLLLAVEKAREALQ